ncbi:MAG: RDD family protein [Flavobacteriaceae bacterium]
MTRQEHLKFCRRCTHQKKDLEKGILCGLTDKIADFEDHCTSFVEEESLGFRGSGTGWSSGVYLNTASQGKRLTNYIIDRIVLLLFSFAFGIVLGIFLALVSPDTLAVLEQGNLFIEYIIAFIFGTIYYSLLEGLTGRSIGKLFTKTKVVNEDGERADFGSIFLRSMCRFIPFNAFSFLGSDAIGWHDTLSKTRVVVVEE